MISADIHAIRARLVSVLSFAASTTKHTIPVSSMIAPALTRPRTSLLLASATWDGIDSNTKIKMNGSTTRTVRTMARRYRAVTSLGLDIRIELFWQTRHRSLYGCSKGSRT